MLTLNTAMPAIGQPWPGQGGIYAGIARGRDGQPDHHLILSAAEPAKRLKWKAAVTWAQDLDLDGHHDYTLPDRFESAVLFGNVADLFEPSWYWTGTQCSDSGAWHQGFSYGDQGSSLKSSEGRARAVRRLPINPSVLSAQADSTAVSA